MTNFDLWIVAALIVWWSLVVGLRLWIWWKEHRGLGSTDSWIEDGSA